MKKTIKETSEIDGEKVSNKKFDQLLKTLKMRPDTQINGECPEGLYTTYEAEDQDHHVYRVTIRGQHRTINRELGPK